MKIGNFVEKVLTVMTTNNLVSTNVKNDDIRNFANEMISDLEQRYHRSPLELLLEFGNACSVSLNSYDDCNSYQEQGYYKDICESVTKCSLGNVAFTEVEENWDDLENVLLSFSLNGKKKSISMNVTEPQDTVPENFIEFMKENLNNIETDEVTTISSGGEYGSSYLFVPAPAGNLLKQIEKEFYEYIRTNRISFQC